MRARKRSHRAEVESGRAYLESILANLSAGVLGSTAASAAQRQRRCARHPSMTISRGCFGTGRCLAAPARPRSGDPRRLRRPPDGTVAQPDRTRAAQRHAADPSVARFQAARGERRGYVVVFDDVTCLSQRSAAPPGARVARRLAHEIKNPLTPIQLSAERLQMKLADKLDQRRRRLPQPWNTDHHQPGAGDEAHGRRFPRLCPPAGAGSRAARSQRSDRRSAGTLRNSSAEVAVRLADGLPLVLGDATQMRQIIHNLLRNAEDAQEDRDHAHGKSARA